MHSYSNRVCHECITQSIYKHLNHPYDYHFSIMTFTATYNADKHVVQVHFKDELIEEIHVKDDTSVHVYGEFADAHLSRKRKEDGTVVTEVRSVSVSAKGDGFDSKFKSVEKFVRIKASMAFLATMKEVMSSIVDTRMGEYEKKIVALEAGENVSIEDEKQDVFVYEPDSLTAKVVSDGASTDDELAEGIASGMVSLFMQMMNDLSDMTMKFDV